MTSTTNKFDGLDPERFIEEQINYITSTVGEDDLAICALSGGVDSSTVTILGNKALGDRLKAYFIDNGLMRLGEPEEVVKTFQDLGVTIEMVDAKEQFFGALEGVIDPEEKREAISETFYRHVFGYLVKTSGAKYLLQGTILTDIDETVAGIKRQHNVLMQLGIDPEQEYGYIVLEPLVQLRKDGVRRVAEALELPESIYNRMPFPGPALAARVIGEVTPERVYIVRQATAIIEEEIGKIKGLGNINPFQYLAILHEDRVTGMRNGERSYGYQIEVRSWDSIDARTATPTQIPYNSLVRLAERLTTEMPEVVSVTYNITNKPPSTMEAI